LGFKSTPSAMNALVELSLEQPRNPITITPLANAS
jgi:hypothetical protein